MGVKRARDMPEKPKGVVVMGTLDTKGLELAYLAQQVASPGACPC
jgi:uncharacterized protein (UPF0261 family)